KRSNIAAAELGAVVSPADTLAGERYVQMLSVRKSDLRVRRTFREAALALLPAGGTIFDFGCGPGVDADFYAERGYTVHAYDQDPEMRRYFGIHCQDWIRAGRVQLRSGSYAEFLDDDRQAG